ncbi:hypothetical protein ILYODFUR_022657 [Ilyodon furcidens]|uniref:Uncharacterized protein n=1 Tax=Ilyodon furcidens TaxID=33524 RepID=A0ABV0T1H5_9TELE
MFFPCSFSRYFAKTQFKFHRRTNLLCPSNQDFSKDIQAKFRLAATDPPSSSVHRANPAHPPTRLPPNPKEKSGTRIQFYSGGRTRRTSAQTNCSLHVGQIGS